MKRLIGLVVLMLTASAAQADSISFSVGGQRVRIDAPRNCRSASCASISIPGIYESRRKRWEDEDREVVAAPPPPPPPPPAPASVPAVGFAPAAPVQQLAPPPAPPPAAVAPPSVVAPQPAPAPKLTVVMVPAPTSLAVYTAAAATTQDVAPPPLPPVSQPPQAATQPCPPAPATNAKPAPPMLKVLREDDQPDSPLGDWQTENKGLVRIAECGRALCGYSIKPGEDEKGEAVLINMKPKTASQWTGSVYSKDSGDTYYGAINLNGPNTLRVEACAIGRFYCHGNLWTRMPKSDRVISSRQIEVQPRT